MRTTKNSATTGTLLPKRALQLVAMAACLFGCDFADKAPEPGIAVEPPVQAAVTSETPATQSAPADTVKITLAAGQTEAEVRKLLGDPSGKLSSSNRIVLLYSGELLEFVDGRLVTAVPDIQERIAAKQKTAAQPVERTADKTKPEPEPKRKINKPSSTKQTVDQKTAKQIVLKDERGREIDHSRLLVSGKITVVDFYATWCGPCKRMTPILEEMVRGQGDVVLRKVDIGNWGSETATRYNVNSVPNVRVFDKRGRLVAPPSSNPDEISGNIELARKQP